MICILLDSEFVLETILNQRTTSITYNVHLIFYFHNVLHVDSHYYECISYIDVADAF